MRRTGQTGLVLTALVAVGVAGYWAGQRGPALPAFAWAQFHGVPATAAAAATPTSTGPIVYYRDPEGRPAYAEGPKKTDDGKDFLPVHASEDLSFDRPAPAGEAIAGAGAEQAGAKPQPKAIRYYRNPMGLPDTSPVPKKDSMGMDYIPVFFGDEEDGPTLKLSPGKLQRTGVRSEPAMMRTLSTPVRASGTVQLDERRKSVIALRFDAYIDKVENITTGSLVRQGQPLMQVYGPDLLAPAAQYVSAVNEGRRTGS
jgi:Cu(I)/Ag(I) efflux system membrane fusion protein